MIKIDTWLPQFGGFYESEYTEILYDEDEYFGFSEIYKLPPDKDFHDFVEIDLYYNNIGVFLCKATQDALSDFIKSIQHQCIVSPKFYNFENDSINCEMEFDENLVLDYLLENSIAFEKYIFDRYSSRDGFTSFYSNNSANWLRIEDWDKHHVGSIFEFILENESILISIPENEFYEFCSPSLFISENILNYEIN